MENAFDLDGEDRDRFLVEDKDISPLEYLLSYAFSSVSSRHDD